MSAVGWRHETIEYADDDAIVHRLTDDIRHEVESGGHVLVCVPERLEDRLAPAVGDLHDVVAFRTLGRRYARPVDAVDLLWHFTHDRLASGAERVLSIGELPVVDAGTPLWSWYERAVDDVFGGLPVAAVCLLDEQRLAADALAAMRHAHAPGGALPMPMLAVPPGPPDRTLETDVPADARRLVATMAEPLGADVVEAAKVVVSELVTNAIRHARSPAVVHVWHDGDDLVLQVTDHGPGLRDHAAALRPPDLPRRGAGLWVCHRLAHAFSVGASPDGGTVANARFTR